MRSSSYRVKLTESFKLPSDLADPLNAPRPCRGHDSDDEDDPDTTPHSPPSLPDISDAISVSAQHLSNSPRCVTPPAPAFPADRIMDDTAWRRQSFHQTLTLLACGDHLAPDVVLCVLKIMILNYSLCYWTVTFKSLQSLSSAFKYFPLCFLFQFSRLNVMYIQLS